MKPRQIIDVSSYQHPTDQPIDWGRVKAAGVSAVMIKSSQGMGTSLVNDWCERDSEGAKAAGIDVGHYHYAIPTVGDADAQADRAFGLIKPIEGVLGLALDLETHSGLTWEETAVWGEGFLAYLSNLKIPSPLYSNWDYLHNMRGAPWGHKLWLANPGPTPPRRSVWAWQYTWTGTVDGIEGNVDRSLLYA